MKLSEEYCLSRSARRGGAIGLGPLVLALVLALGGATPGEAVMEALEGVEGPPGDGAGEWEDDPASRDSGARDD